MVMAIGKSVQRKGAWEKVTGFAQYTDDFPTTGCFAPDCSQAHMDMPVF